MSSTGFSIGTTWATRICKEKNFISRIQVHPHIRVWHPDYMTIGQETRWHLLGIICQRKARWLNEQSWCVGTYSTRWSVEHWFLLVESGTQKSSTIYTKELHIGRLACRRDSQHRGRPAKGTRTDTRIRSAQHGDNSDTFDPPKTTKYVQK